MLKKIVIFCFIFIFAFCQSAFAAMFSTDFNKVISDNNLDRTSTVSIVAKDIKTSKVLYQKNAQKLLNTASILKLLTFAASLDTLGKDYKFETAVYADANNNLYIKLGADPLLSADDLNFLIELAKTNYKMSKVNCIYIDDKIISNIPYPDGWMVDDFWPTIAPISPYIVDLNKIKVRLILSPDKTSINIVQDDKCRFSFINRLEIADKTNINISKDYGDMQSVITLSGTIADDTNLTIPVNNPKYFFISRLEDAFVKNKTPYSKQFYFKQTPAGARKIASVYHTIDEVSIKILKFSDNFCAETLFRVAGQKYAKVRSIKPESPNLSLGTTKNAILMFKEYYTGAGLNTDEITIVDGSGVSHYNAFSVNWIADALIYLDKNTDIRKYMEGADEGTLSKRLRYLKGSIWAKTGTHNNLSSLAGILAGKKGKDIAFAIIIQSYSKSKTSLKAIEDDFVDCIFNL